MYIAFKRVREKATIFQQFQAKEKNLFALFTRRSYESVLH